MSSQRIEKILQKYYQGETSLVEERQLREYFLKEELPHHLSELRDQFEMFELEGTEELPATFDEELFSEIEKQERGRKASKRTMIYYISGVAATVLILITVFFNFIPFNSNKQYTDQEAEVAFTETSRILYFVSDKFNQGTHSMKKIARFDEGLDDLENVKKFDEGVHKTGPLSRFSQITNLIMNPAP